MEDWGVDGAAVGCFGGGEEGDEFAIEPDYAVDVVVSMNLVTMFKSVESVLVPGGMASSPEVVYQVQMDDRRSLVQIHVCHDRSLGILVAWVVCVSPQLQLLFHHRPLRGRLPRTIVMVHHSRLLAPT